MSLYHKEECVYLKIINLDNRPDRYDKIVSIINNCALKNCWIKRFSAINGFNLIEDLKQKNLYEDPLIPLLKGLRQDIACGELGAFLSHYFILKDIIEDSTLHDNDLIMIMEDDFKLVSNFNERFSNVIRDIRNQNDTVNVIYLGGRFHENFEPRNYELFDRLSEHIYLRNLDKLYLYYGQPVESFDDLFEPRVHNYDRTIHAYIIRKRIAQPIIDFIIQFLITTGGFLPVDTYIYGMMKPTFDVFPHLFYSPLHNEQSNIQNDNLEIRFNTENL